MWLLKSSIQSCTFAAAVLVAAAAVPVAAATASVPLLHRSHDLPPRPRHTQHKPDQEPPQPPPLPKGKTRKYLRYVRAAGPLTAVLSGTIFVKIFNPSSISLVGDIPQGLPSFSIPRAFGYATSLIPTALLITGVAILESVGIAKALAAKNGYELDSNQELFGLGVANIFGSFFSAYPTTGSFSRSAVNHESGAKSGLSGLVMGVLMGCALLFMTPLFEYIPQVALLRFWKNG